MMDRDKDRGIYRKYEVTRTDGSSAPGRKHARCAYFVLDLKHDKYAAIALSAYSNACRAKFPALADDIDTMIADASVQPTPLDQGAIMLMDENADVTPGPER